MKNLKFLVIALALIVGVSSCKKEKNDTSIIGKWFMKSRVNKDFTNGELKSENTKTNFTSQDFIEFKDGGVVILGEGELVETATYRLSNDKKMLTLIEKDGGEDSYVIKTLNATDMVLYAEYTENEDGIIYKDTEEISLKR